MWYSSFYWKPVRKRGWIIGPILGKTLTVTWQSHSKDMWSKW